MIQVVDGSTPEHIPIVRTLFQEYAAWMGFDFCFQGFEEELAALPGLYAPPAGCILLAMDNADPAGVVALRPLPYHLGSGCGQTQHGAKVDGANVCEMKRLWVRKPFRGIGLGRRLAESIVSKGIEMGYESMVLDTLERLTSATAIYRSMGFEPIDAYYANPVEGVVYLRLSLAAARISSLDAVER